MMTQYFAQLDKNNVVTHVAVVTAEFMAQNPDRYPDHWVETFFDSPTKQYAGIGMIYDEESDDFVAPPSPEPSSPA